MTQASRSRRVAEIYGVLLIAVVAATYLSVHIGSDLWRESDATAINQIANAFAHVFGSGWLPLIVGAPIASRWARYDPPRKPKARQFLIASVIASAVSALATIVLLDPISRVDCGDVCVWYLYQQSVALLVDIMSLATWVGISIGVFVWMRSQSIR